MAVVSSSDVELPKNIADGIVEKAKTGSAVAALSGQEAYRFGETTIVTFDEDLTAEFVEESRAKSSDDAKPASVTAVPHKTVVQFRTSDEFKWADEDYQLGILNQFQIKCSRALGRALDLGLFYRINPRTGSTISAWSNYLNSTSKRGVVGDDADIDFETAAGLVIGDGYAVNGVAFDPKHAWTLSTARYSDGRKKYPELGLGSSISAFEGVNASVSSTVSGKAKDGDATDNGVRAILGDFAGGVRWGVQKTIPFRMLEFGDPDNTGRDLAGHNEVLFRAEVVYAWYVFSERFAVLDKKTVSSLAITPITGTAGNDYQLTATATYGDGSTADVTQAATDWASASPSKATVTDGGLLTAVATGTSSITCKFGGTTGTATFTVS